MRLSEVQDRHGRGAITRLAERAGMAPARIHEIIKRGCFTPKVDTAKRIEAASRELWGDEDPVSAAELLGLDDSPTPATADHVSEVRKPLDAEVAR
jgi:hypothetical protein